MPACTRCSEADIQILRRRGTGSTHGNSQSPNLQLGLQEWLHLVQPSEPASLGSVRAISLSRGKRHVCPTNRQLRAGITRHRVEKSSHACVWLACTTGAFGHRNWLHLAVTAFAHPQTSAQLTICSILSSQGCDREAEGSMCCTPAILTE